jgi:hypothetical protein
VVDGERVLRLRPVGEGSDMGVVTATNPDDAYRTHPCPTCPWNGMCP